jgi:NAD(P)-dependent dehydrogenase (short-subunit alcohol dehydrogenase family)
MGATHTLSTDHLSRQVVVVTGSAGRLGSAICDIYGKTSSVLAVYNKKEPEFASQLRRRVYPSAEDSDGDGEVYSVQADLTDRGDIRRVVEIALARFGQIDVLINAAADIHFHGNLSEMIYQNDEALCQLHINSIAPILLASAIFQNCWKDNVKTNRLRNRNLVNVSSQSALYVSENRGQGFYAASKAALNLLTLFQAAEFEAYGVRANAICPGTFRDPTTTRRVAEEVIKLVQGYASSEIVTKC